MIGISNAASFRAPWPEVENLREKAMSVLGNEGILQVEDLFGILSDRCKVEDPPHLPSTGVGADWEVRLSSIMIVEPQHGYGTRSSTVMMINNDGTFTVAERTYDETGASKGDVVFEMGVESTCLS